MRRDKTREERSELTRRVTTPTPHIPVLAPEQGGQWRKENFKKKKNVKNARRRRGFFKLITASSDGKQGPGTCRVRERELYSGMMPDRRRGSPSATSCRVFCGKRNDSLFPRKGTAPKREGKGSEGKGESYQKEKRDLHAYSPESFHHSLLFTDREGKDIAVWGTERERNFDIGRERLHSLFWGGRGGGRNPTAGEGGGGEDEGRKNWL